MPSWLPIHSTATTIWSNGTTATYPITLTLTGGTGSATSYYYLDNGTWSLSPAQGYWPNRELRMGVDVAASNHGVGGFRGFQEDAERRRAITAAVDRATATLLGLLNEEQRASYERDRTFLVVGSHGGLYQIGPGSMGNVEWFDPTHPDVAAGRLCAHPQRWDDEGGGILPDPDIALGQLLHLVTDEPGFLRTANVHAGRAPRYPVAA